MNKKFLELPKIWKYYFYFGFILINIHYLRYLNLFVTKTIPYLAYIVDYSFYTNQSFVLRIISFILTILVYKKREKYPVLATAYVWISLFVLLSYEHDKYTFLSSLLISVIAIFSSMFYKVRLSKK
tara:strand:+ start:4990 stop:5367 length:378 start_codon:yes stop_codon:yes gene_type:complete